MPIQRPSDLIYADTAAYVAQFAPKKKSRILDVGCGSGELAAVLSAAGHTVVPIDSSADTVEKARAKGIDAQHADFLDTALLDSVGGPFDAVLFSYALHHISPLDKAIAKIREVLAPGGRVILEEFAIERVDAATAAWFFGTQDVLIAESLLEDMEPSGVLEGKEPLARWRERFEPGRHGHSHGHPKPEDGKAKGDAAHGDATHGDATHGDATHGDATHRGHGREGHGHFSEKLHDGDAMRVGIASTFRIVHEERTPALARFWLHRLGKDALPVARQLVALERLLIAQGVIRPFGFRIVAELK